ncbi:hypothetical protein [Candidatus Pelagibacter sp. HIMB1782]|uniref:hypothetical protein n=1 Tax=Candidatus Pelagibacter sp. HIMB1782 TaxID=3413375 RepID=UPI003F862FF1
MKKFRFIFIIFLLFLHGCGDSDEVKVKKHNCNNFSQNLTIDIQKCIEDQKYYEELTFENNVFLTKKRLDEFNNKVDEFNSINIGVKHKEYKLLNIQEFLEKNKIQSDKDRIFIKNIERKKIKFNTYFEASMLEDEKKYIIYFYDYFGNLLSRIKKEDKNLKEPLLKFGNFQNIEIERKFETLLDDKFRIGSTRYSIPLKKNNATIYGYFLNTEYTGFDAAIKDLNLIINKNKNSDNKIEDLKITASEFFITDIELNKITYTEEEVRKIIKDNELASSLLINQL